jgi:hypothetical protein
MITLGKRGKVISCAHWFIALAAALEVYVRRSYRAYTLLSLDYEEGDDFDDGEVPSVVTWRFNLGQSHSPPSTPRFGYDCPLIDDVI